MFLESEGHAPLILNMLEEKQLKFVIARAVIKECEDEIKTLQDEIDNEDFTDSRKS